MDYEKKYKEAITAIDDLISLLRKHEVISSDGIIVSNLQRIFPELPKVKEEKINKEHERIRKMLIAHFKHHNENCIINDEIPAILTWLEKQKEQKEQKPAEVDESTKRLNENWMKQYFDEQQPAEWSEEDERYINGLIGLIEDMKVGISPKLRGVAADRCIVFLKSLRPQPHWKKSFKTADLENSLCDLQDNYHDGSYEYKVLGEAIEFIRCAEPRPHWKPSEKQMNCLCAAVDAAIRKHNESVSGYEPARVLKSLYEQLKKL